ncbi:osmoregulated proline transporter [Colwellia sp. MT41]|uniref:Sodium:solute symport protein n=1 Tax=Colwellia marinimaniae TaxID=1513592 RepID=A0ABQ0MS05_9GAMM|nr:MULTISPECIES: sodium:solute symporter family protein [Colwellia]ALO35069.1 osmoregulated proline transporter [Colwellia sp. MT41]GAW95161.1 sodium:solute symport protein [Colwellia marinimaniae]
MDFIDLVVIGVYFCVLIGIGLYAGSKIKNAEDYMVAGRSLGFPVLLGTLVGSAIGAAATFGKAGKAYEVGYAILIATVAYVLGYIVLCFLAPKLQQAKIDTIPGALERRFGKPMRIIAAVVLVLAVIALFGAQLIAIGLTAEAVFSDFGITFEYAVVIATVVIIVYTLVGGLLAVAYNDLFQTIIMLIGGGLLLPIFLTIDLGDQFSSALVSPAIDFLGGMHWGYVLSFFPIYFAFVLIDPTIWQRISASKNSADLKPAFIATACIFMFWSLIVVTLGVIAFNILPDLAHRDSVIPTLVLNHMPPLVKGICLAAIMGIIISTADSALLVTGTTVSTDLVKVLKPEISDKQQLLITRITIFVVGIFGLIFALQKSNIFEIMMLSLAIFVSGLFVPVMSALFYKKATATAALTSAIVGAVVQLSAFFAKMQGYLPEGVEPILLALVSSSFAMWLMSQLTYKPSLATQPLLINLKAK